jgi:cytochrome c oxidase assembly factor CtaG
MGIMRAVFDRSRVGRVPIVIQELIMHTPEVKRILLAIAVAASIQSASAHHGWAWAEDQQSTLTGKIQSISMSAPHPTLQVTDAAGATWQVDLGNPSQTERSGFTAESAKAGDAITVLGNRNREKERKHMKAVRITIGGKQFDLYPERITPN